MTTSHDKLNVFSLEQEAHYEAYFTPAALDRTTAMAFKMSPYLRSRKVLQATNLGEAIRGCDTYAKTKVVLGSMALGYVLLTSFHAPIYPISARLLRTAKWRKGPASEQQQKLVAKRHGKLGPDPDAIQSLRSLTKGEAANIITRLKHGAKVGILQAYYK